MSNSNLCLTDLETERGMRTDNSGRKIINILGNGRFWDLLQRVKLGINECLFSFMTITFTKESLNVGVFLYELASFSDSLVSTPFDIRVKSNDPMIAALFSLVLSLTYHERMKTILITGDGFCRLSHR